MRALGALQRAFGERTACVSECSVCVCEPRSGAEEDRCSGLTGERQGTEARASARDQRRVLIGCSSPVKEREGERRRVGNERPAASRRRCMG